MSQVKYVYSYDKEYDKVEVKTLSSFNFTHYHRDLLLKAVQAGEVELKGKFYSREYSKAFDELTKYNLLVKTLSDFFVTGKVVSKQQAMKLIKCYNEE